MDIMTALNPQEMGPIVATRKMMRVRPDGMEDWVTVEVGVPREFTEDPRFRPTWVCNLKISIVPGVLAALGESSLDAIINATYFAAKMLGQHPLGAAIDMSLLPNFGFPLCPTTTTPEALAQEQNRPKTIRPA